MQVVLPGEPDPAVDLERSGGHAKPASLAYAFAIDAARGAVSGSLSTAHAAQ